MVCWFRIIRILTGNLELILNSIIIIDLYYTMRNPFVKRQSRVKYYVMFIAVCVIGLLAYYVVHYYNYMGSNMMISIEPSIADSPRYEYYSRLIVLTYACLCFFRVLFRLCAPGTSQTLRWRVTWRFILYFLVFLTRFVPPLLLVKE